MKQIRLTMDQRRFEEISMKKEELGCASVNELMRRLWDQAGRYLTRDGIAPAAIVLPADTSDRSAA